MTAPILAPEAANIAVAAAALKAGRLIAFPTETVYGLGGDATNDNAVAAIFEAKSRPAINPLIIHVSDRTMAEQLGQFDDRARRLSERHWPGPLTIVLPRQRECPVSLLATAGLDTLALRLARHPVAAALLRSFAGPIAAPSANPSGRISPTTAAHVAESLGDKPAAILDGGPSTIGLESTIVDLSGARPRLLRPGGLPVEEIEALIGPLAASDAGERPRAPGMLASHYAPCLPLRLNVRTVESSDALLAFGPRPLAGAGTSLNLSLAGDVREAAANLFAYLRRLDASGARAIAVMPIPAHGLGQAINDRLCRAAASHGS